MTVGVHAKHAAILGPARGEGELAREAAGATRERAEQRVGDAVGRDAHVGFVDGELLLVNGLFADVQKVRDAEDLDFFALGARGDLDDGFGAELFPRVDVDGVVEGIHAGRRVGVLDDVEHAGELDVVAHDGAHDHVFEIGRERGEDGDAREFFDLVAGDDELTERASRSGLAAGRGRGRGGRSAVRQRRVPAAARPERSTAPATQHPRGDEPCDYSHEALLPEKLGLTWPPRMSG